MASSKAAVIRSDLDIVIARTLARDTAKALGFGAIDQPPKLGTVMHRRAGDAVAAVEDIAVDRGLVGDAETNLRLAPVQRAIVIDHNRVGDRIGIAHAVCQDDDAARFAQRVEIAANGIERLAGGVGAAGLEHHVGGDQARVDIDQRGAKKRITVECIRRLAGEACRKRAPCVA